MEYRHLGRFGVKVSPVCLGTMNFGPYASEEEAHAIMDRALELGINFFDTADMYSDGVSEEVLGRAVRDFAKREEVVIATKVFYPTGPGPNDRGLSRRHVLAAIDSSLKRLGMDHVDLYQIHRYDPETPIEETLEALNDVVRSGKARYIGASSMFAWQFAQALALSDRRGLARFVSMQNHLNLIYREEEREMIPLCLQQGIGLIPWSPMARGFFAGNRSRDGSGDTPRARKDDFARALYFQDEDFKVAERAWEVAKERKVSASQIALAWLLNKPHISAPIIGASKMEHLDQAIAALELKLSQEEIDRLEEYCRPHPIRGHS